MIHNPQSGGKHLPALTNPAGAAQILNGYQAINADGEIVVGSIPSQGAQTITPGTANKTIAAGRYLSGTQTIAGDADLVAGNIKSGVNLFGVNGTLEGLQSVTLAVLNDTNTTVYVVPQRVDDSDEFYQIGRGATENIPVAMDLAVCVFMFFDANYPASINPSGLSGVRQLDAASRNYSGAQGVNIYLFQITDETPSITVTDEWY